MLPSCTLSLLLLFLLLLSSGDSCSQQVEQLGLEVERMRLENSLATWQLREQMTKSIREQERLKAKVEEQETALTTLEDVPHGTLPGGGAG